MPTPRVRPEECCALAPSPGIPLHILETADLLLHDDRGQRLTTPWALVIARAWWEHCEVPMHQAIALMGVDLLRALLWCTQAQTPTAAAAALGAGPRALRAVARTYGARVMQWDGY